MQEPETRNVYLAPGALPDEPQCVAREPVPYKQRLRYTALPWGVFGYVAHGDEYAKKYGGKLDIAVAGTGRLVEKYGVEDLEVVRSIFHGTMNEEQRQYMEHLLISEQIRKSLFLAIAQTLGISNIGNVVSETEQLQMDKVTLDSLLNRIAELQQGVDRGNGIRIPFSGSKTDRRAFGEALIRGLPKRIRESIPGDITNITTATVPSLLYLLHELGLAEKIIEKGVFSGERGIYLTHKGSVERDTDKAYSGEERSPIDWLRETFIEWHKASDLVRGMETQKYWIVDKRLDDWAFARRRSSPWAEGVPRDPYYGERNDASVRSLHVLYATPVVQGFVSHMGGSGGGIRNGQPEMIARFKMMPVLSLMIDAVRDAPDSAFALCLKSLGDENRVKSWIAEHDAWNKQYDRERRSDDSSEEQPPPVVPPFLSLQQFEQLIASVSTSVIEKFDKIVGDRDRYAIPSP